MNQNLGGKSQEHTFCKAPRDSYVQLRLPIFVLPSYYHDVDPKTLERSVFLPPSLTPDPNMGVCVMTFP